MGIVKESLYKVANGKLVSFFKNHTIYPYYHLVNDEKVAHIENLYAYKNSSQFKADLKLLVANYKPIDPKNLFVNVEVKNSFLLSYDDGLEEVYSVVFPLLQQYNIKAIFFINPNFVDNKESLYKHDISIIIKHLKENNFDKNEVKTIANLIGIDFITNEDFVEKLKSIPFSQRSKVKEILAFLSIDIDLYLKEQKPYISKQQIKEMLDAGHYFGGHTMSHPPLNQLTHLEKKKEIIDSMEWLKINFGISYSLFAFPFSDKGISKQLLQELFEYDPNIRLFGNSGLKKDIDNRIIQRFSLENPKRTPAKLIVAEHFYKWYNILILKYQIRRS